MVKEVVRSGNKSKSGLNPVSLEIDGPFLKPIAVSTSNNLTDMFLFSSFQEICFTDKTFYQSPLIFTELFQHNLINVSYLTACYLYQVMMTLHFFNDVANDAESIQKSNITS